MSIALIVPGTLWDEPFVRIYSNFLEQKGIEFDIISWNRDGRDKPESIQYNLIQPLNSNKLAKLIGYYKFANFARKIVKNNKYEKLIIFGPQAGLFMTSLLKRYSGNYIFDYRDLSLEQMPVFKRALHQVLRHSYANVISSVGFKKALPSEYEYLICHNFDIDFVAKAFEQTDENHWNTEAPVKILTIGSIRDYDSNTAVIDALSNKEQFLMQFVGQGLAVDGLKKYCQSNSVKNVEFKGFYPKTEEPNYIKVSSFMNIFYPRKISHDTALSNRFYNSLIFKRPMIVTKDTTQGDYVEQYHVGLAIESCEHIDDAILEFFKNDYKEYAERCNTLLRMFLEEQRLFSDRLTKFIQ